MSALGSILAAVEEKVRAVLGEFTERDDAQDARLDEIEKRLTDLEGSQAPAAKSSPTVAAKARGAQAGK